MLLRQLKYFVTIIDKNSFTEAANELFISQSAISQQVKALEEELGVELIKRQNRKFTMTPAGEFFYNKAKNILKEISNLKKEIARLDQISETTLKIGYLNSYNGLELYKAIDKFTNKYPEVKIEVFNGTHEELYNLIKNKELDIILNDQRRALSNEYINFSLGSYPLSIEISKRNYLSENEEIKIEELNNIPIIIITPDDQREIEQEYYSEILGFNNPFIFSANLEEARLLASGNKGVLPIDRVGDLPDALATLNRISVLKNGSPVERNFYFFWKSDNENEYINEFAKTFKKLIES